MRYISERTESMKQKILKKSKDLFGDVSIELHWSHERNCWWIKVTIDKNDIIEYNVITENNDIDFKVIW